MIKIYCQRIKMFSKKIIICETAHEAIGERVTFETESKL
jgi:hypothetical protein